MTGRRGEGLDTRASLLEIMNAARSFAILLPYGGYVSPHREGCTG